MDITINESEKLSLSGDECVIYMYLGTRLLEWDMETHLITKITDTETSMKQMVYRRDNGETYFFDNGSLWLNLLRHPFENMYKYKVFAYQPQMPEPEDIPIIVNYDGIFDHRSKVDNFNKYPCLLDNGGCSDICNPGLEDNERYCTCGSGREHITDNPDKCGPTKYKDQQKEIDSPTDKENVLVYLGSSIALAFLLGLVIAVWRKYR